MQEMHRESGDIPMIPTGLLTVHDHKKTRARHRAPATINRRNQWEQALLWQEQALSRQERALSR